MGWGAGVEGCVCVCKCVCVEGCECVWGGAGGLSVHALEDSRILQGRRRRDYKHGAVTTGMVP